VFKISDKDVTIKGGCKTEFYWDEFQIDLNLTFQKCWQKNNDVKGIIMGSLFKRLIIVHTGSQNGFLPGGHLMYKAGQTHGNY